MWAFALPVGAGALFLGFRVSVAVINNAFEESYRFNLFM